MTTFRTVKTRLLLLSALCLSGFAAGAEPEPDAQEILRIVRIAQASQHQRLVGTLRTGAKKIPFTLAIDGGTIRYEFKDPTQVIQLRLLEKDSRLEEITKGGTEKVSAARFDARVRDSDISYEDLAMKFLYWPKAVVEGEQIMLLRKCWILHTEPASSKESQYSKVLLWIDKQAGALMQAEAYDHAGKLARRFKVLAGQKVEGSWILKEMRIEAPGTGVDRSPTYLKIDGLEK